jgi:hypothetical protein
MSCDDGRPLRKVCEHVGQQPPSLHSVLQVSAKTDTADVKKTKEQINDNFFIILLFNTLVNDILHHCTLEIFFLFCKKIAREWRIKFFFKNIRI